MVKNPPSIAGDEGSIPGWGTKIPHGVEQLDPCTATGEPCDARKKACALQQKTQAQPKKKKINKMLGEGWISKAQSFKRTGWKNGGCFALGQGLKNLPAMQETRVRSQVRKIP